MVAVEDEVEKKTIDNRKPKACLGIRHVQAVMLFLVLVLAYAMRVNMSMAIVVMTDDRVEDVRVLPYLAQACLGIRCMQEHFEWSIQTQSVILSSFFWGYVVLQIPAGELATRVGGSILIISAMTINTLICGLMPFAARYGGWQLVCGCRVLQGLTQGAIVPSVHNIIGKWVPIEEKSRLGALIYAGSQLGSAVQFLTSGFIAEAWGWEGIFYVNGVCGAVWVVLYFFLGAASPQISKIITAEERLYIQTSLGQVGQQKKLKTPWKSIWTSLPFLALFIIHCSQNWGFTTLMTETPSYMKLVLGIDVKASGVLTAMPYLGLYLLSFPFGIISDYLINSGILSVTATRKLSNSIGLYGPGIALIGLSYTPAGNVVAAVALLTAVVALNVGHITGLMLVHLDMSPNFAGTLLGITNGCANIISIIAPLVAGAVLKDESDPEEWRKVFYIAASVYIIGNTIHLIFGTSEKQAWNDPEDTRVSDPESTTATEKNQTENKNKY